MEERRKNGSVDGDGDGEGEGEGEGDGDCVRAFDKSSCVV